jgi:hypothetical protein
VSTQFRTEFFNTFNQTNFDAGGFGSIARTLPGGAGEPRIVRFGLKPTSELACLRFGASA